MITHADRINVVEDGMIVESGRHDELLRKGGRYASFYRLQLRERRTVAGRDRVQRVSAPGSHATAAPVSCATFFWWSSASRTPEVLVSRSSVASSSSSCTGVMRGRYRRAGWGRARSASLDGEDPPDDPDQLDVLDDEVPAKRG